MQQSNDTLIGFIIALGLHAFVLLVFILSGLISKTAVMPESKGQPVQASVMISAADIMHAQKSIRESKAAPPPKPASAAQPIPEARPQTADTPQQMTAQAPVINPESVDQERIDKLAVLETDEKIVAEREARQRQAQIDLTEDIKRQEQAENKQRLREQQVAQLAAIRLSREAAEKETRRIMEDQRLQQLADRAESQPVRSPPGPVDVTSGNPNAKNNLLAQYRLAIKKVVENNWRRDGAQPSERCLIKFRQIQGGQVIDVTFLDCPFSPEGRASAQRALLMSNMPYAGFESVFDPSPTITLCYPADLCEK